METILLLINENSKHIMTLLLTLILGMLGAFANAMSVKDFKNGFHYKRILLSVGFVTPTVYILLMDLVDPKLQMLLTVLAGAFHEDAIPLLRGRFKLTSGIIKDQKEKDQKHKITPPP